MLPAHVNSFDPERTLQDAMIMVIAVLGLYLRYMRIIQMQFTPGLRQDVVA